MILKLGEIDNYNSFMAKRFKGEEKIFLNLLKDLKIFFNRNDKILMICVKDVFNINEYGSSYMYKFLYSFQDLNQLIKIGQDNFMPQSTFNRWIDIRINNSKKIDKLRKIINVIFEFLNVSQSEIEKKSLPFVCSIEEFILG
jgi:hypothetical protein